MTHTVENDAGVEPYYSDEWVTLHHGDSLAALRTMPDASVNCCVTSPPYFGLRDYGESGQYGLESSPAEYVETMRAVFAEVRRVLTDDGTLWLNLGDSYGPDKNLVGIPWRTAFAIQEDGWLLRNDIIWTKPNAMPESVGDRLSCKHEHLFMLSKSPRYWFDVDPIRENRSPATIDRYRYSFKADPAAKHGTGMRGGMKTAGSEAGKNPGDVWEVPTQPFGAAHFAVMPTTLAERSVLAGCKPGGVVLDPFSGSGTTGLAATKHGRRYVGIDLSADYLDISLRTRFAQPGLDLDGGAA
jgi:site-specific DNA-methyltransferase (cytosine-N4-specific)